MTKFIGQPFVVCMALIQTSMQSTAIQSDTHTKWFTNYFPRVHYWQNYLSQFCTTSGEVKKKPCSLWVLGFESMGSRVSKGSQEPEDPPIETPIAKNCKICVIGPKSVGKSCFVQRYVKGGFTPAYSPDTTGH